MIMVAFLFLSSVCAYPQDHGDAFVSGSISDARTLMPLLASDSASADACGMIFNGLVKFDKDLNLTGDLAQSWEIKDDGLAIVFHLKKDVRWHDGAPFTADDVAFTYSKLIDPDLRTPYSGDFERVRSFEILDEHTVKITYKEPFAPGLASWGMAIIPKHLLAKKDLNLSELSRNPVGTGPYKLKKWSSQEEIELSVNRAYFEKKPFISRYIYRIIPDESTIFLEMQIQGVDSSALTPLQYKRQTDTSFFKTHYHKFNLPGMGYTYLGYNLANPKFKDKRIRQALNYAVNKDELIKMVLLGYGKVADGPFAPQSWAHTSEVKPASFNREIAKELLKQCGWKDTNNDGWLDKEGQIFEFTILTNQGNEERVKTAEIIQKRLKDIGIRVKIKVVEWNVFLTEFIGKRNFETVLLGWSLPREPDNYDIWHSSKTKEGEFNFIGYKNEEVDRLLTEARKTFDQEKRKHCYNKIQELLYEDQPYMFLYVPDSLSAVNKRFRGIQPAPAGIGYNFIDWWVPKPEQKYRMLEN